MLLHLLVTSILEVIHISGLRLINIFNLFLKTRNNPMESLYFCFAPARIRSHLMLVPYKNSLFCCYGVIIHEFWDAGETRGIGNLD